ncbi:inactive pancreatic lipase-related protein 1-like [Sander lucioperca]|uniref:inactive pancreatic lipase-related protein 1-like n=1 Tax=Sander lucioperca TaxID=283035 RepID=UPI00125CEB28|nr:inactive pancreatic lipase-related protein 1-like [Sander lucioperca]XP_035858752.1 inactive pancreatic lipase-related protein 1-like [Sander lucioperca]XP_035858753.1 inactive pancreatic lipase-related protein 1-like [Sander lucioperca]
MSHIWSLFCFLIGTAYAAEVCFNELGCFNDLPPWGGTDQRPVSVLPWHPDQIGTRFLLFTQKNRYYQEIKTDQTIHASNYGGKRKTRFIIPGYLKKGDEDWPQEMCKVMLKLENVNCIAVEWKKGVTTQYVQAANNARVLAAQVAFMITFLKANFKQTSDKFHIIGHSLGAHAAGDAGNRTAGLARITGLDPTEPYFQDTDASVRLDTSDAAFVDVIHTDGLSFKSKLGLGMSQSVGHIDFYPNGGELMPGCSANKGRPSDLDAIWEGTKKFDACNHARAYKYYSESIFNRQGFVAYPCSNKDSFAAGKCFPCGDDTCPLMGYYADRVTVTDGISETKYFLNTGSSEPFGRYSYKVKVTLDGPSWPNPGFMYVALVGDNDSTEEYKLHRGTMKPGQTYEVLIDAEVDIGDATEVKFRWNNHILNPLRPKYGASKVELQRGKDNKIVFFCGIEKVVENAIQHVLPC